VKIYALWTNFTMKVKTLLTKSMKNLPAISICLLENDFLKRKKMHLKMFKDLQMLLIWVSLRSTLNFGKMSVKIWEIRT
jgi:hypothetical protein